MNGFEIEPGIIISKLNIKENDPILVTIDTDKWDLDDGYEIFKIMTESFPHNTIVTTFKGIEIEKLKEKEI